MTTNLENLIYTLDILYYENMTELEKKELEDYLYTTNNKPLRTIINNYKNRKENNLNIDYLFGPIEVKLCTYKDKKILLIGENHNFTYVGNEYKYENTNSKNIMNTYEFLLYLFKYSYVPIDFYLESQYTNKIDTDSKYVMGKLRSILRPCLNKSFECPYYIGRFHYTDLRSLNDKNSIVEANRNFFYNFKTLKDIRSFRKIVENARIECKAYYELMNAIENCSNEEIKKQSLDFIETRYKSFFKTQLKRYNTRLLFYVKGYSNEIAKDAYSKILENLEKDYKENKVDKKHIFGLCDLLYYPISMMISSFADHYTICKMFSSVDTNTDKVVHIEQKNIIFYGGQYHTENMSTILEDVGAEVIDLKSFPINKKQNAWLTPINIDLFGINKVKNIEQNSFLEKEWNIE